MSVKNFNRYEVVKQTSADILNNEKADVDEIELNLVEKQGDRKQRNGHYDFLQGINPSSEKTKIDDIKTVQMRVYASNSSDLYMTSSFTSVALSIIAVFCMTLLFAVVLEVVLLSGLGYIPRVYQGEDMSPLIEKGDTIFEIDAKDANLNKDTIITYQYEGNMYTRVITIDNDPDYIVVNTPDEGNLHNIPRVEAANQIKSVVANKISLFGGFVSFTYNNWYFVCGGLLLFTLLLFGVKIFVDKKFNQRLLEMFEYGKLHREKRRQYLVEEIMRMQNNRNLSAGNRVALKGLLDVNKEPENKRERKMQRLQKQLKQRQYEQIEALKGLEERRGVVNAQPEKEASSSETKQPEKEASSSEPKQPEKEQPQPPKDGIEN